MSGEYYNRSLIIPEPALQVLPSMAEALGLEVAIVYQQLFFLLQNEKCGRIVNGKKWIFNTYGQWAEMFPFWSERNIRRIFERMEEMFLVESCQPEGVVSRRKYYRLNEGMLAKVQSGKVLIPNKGRGSRTGPTGHIDRPNGTLPITETTCRDYVSKEPKETAVPAVDGFLPEIPAKWKPDTRTIEEKLRTLKVPKNYPSELEFETFLDEQGLYEIQSKRCDLYEDLCNHKWHQKKNGKLKPIRDWRKYVVALNEHMTR